MGKNISLAECKENPKKQTTNKQKNIQSKSALEEAQDYKIVLRLWREKARRAKAQLELNLAPGVKEKSFYKYISTKRRIEDSFHPLLDVEEIQWQRVRKRLSYVMPSLLQYLRDPLFCRYPAPWAGRQKQGPKWSFHTPRGSIQWPAILLRNTQVYGGEWDPPKGSEGAGWNVHKVLSSVYQKLWLTGDVPVDCSFANVKPVYKKSQKKDLGN